MKSKSATRGIIYKPSPYLGGEGERRTFEAKVGAYPVSEACGLADVEDTAAGVLHEVNAGLDGNGGEKLSGALGIHGDLRPILPAAGGARTQARG